MTDRTARSAERAFRLHGDHHSLRDLLMQMLRDGRLEQSDLRARALLGDETALSLLSPSETACVKARTDQEAFVRWLDDLARTLATPRAWLILGVFLDNLAAVARRRPDDPSAALLVGAASRFRSWLDVPSEENRLQFHDACPRGRSNGSSVLTAAVHVVSGVPELMLRPTGDALAELSAIHSVCFTALGLASCTVDRLSFEESKSRLQGIIKADLRRELRRHLWLEASSSGALQASNEPDTRRLRRQSD